MNQYRIANLNRQQGPPSGNDFSANGKQCLNFLCHVRGQAHSVPYLHRTCALWGRINEMFGEDPLLAGAMGAAQIRGIPVISTVKHFVVSTQESNSRLTNKILDDRTLQEIYVRPWISTVPIAHLA